MSILKKLLFTVIFVIAVIFIPGIILLLTVNAETDFSVYVVVYGIILFGIFGYIIVSIHSLSKQLTESMDDLKKQNAAIAHALLSNTAEAPEAPAEEEKLEPKATSNVVLNPADPLPTIPQKGNDTFGDFE